MSSVGQVVGGAVGLFFGGPMGAQIGIMLGGLLDPPKLPTINGPRVSDLSVQTATYAATIPRVYGTVAVKGNVFWVEGDRIRESVKKKKSGGKGGPSQTTKTYSYSATFAVGLCKGPIAGVRRIWVGARLIYDAGSSDLEAIIASNQAASGFKIYVGSETQNPDPRMQADKGVSNTPGYRGLAYIVFYDLGLAEYGNSLMGAQVKVEVAVPLSSGFQMQQLTTPAPSQIYAGVWANDKLTLLPYGTLASSSYDGTTFFQRTIASANRTVVAYNGREYLATRDGGSLIDYSTDGVMWTTATLPSSGQRRGLAWNGVLWITPRLGTTECAFSYDGLTWQNTALPAARTWQRCAWNGSVFCAIAENSDRFAVSSDGLFWEEVVVPESASWYGISAKNGRFCVIAYTGSTGLKVAISDDNGQTWSVVNHSSLRNAYRSIESVGDYFVTSTFGDRYVAYSPTGDVWLEVDVGSSQLWNVVPGPSGTFYLVSLNNNTDVRLFKFVTEFGNTLVLSTIVQSETLQSKLILEQDINTSTLTDQVRGYRISQQGAIRGAIEPLQTAYPFDVVQRGYQLHYVRRPKAPVAVVDEIIGEFRVDREMDAELPREVTVEYLDVDREYE